MILAFFVDDMLMTGPCINLLHVQDTLKTRFFISELGTVLLILGMKVIIDEARGTLNLSQHDHVKPLLERFGMDSPNLAYTPGTPNQLVDDASEDTLLEPSEKTKYHAMTGSLIFLAQSTRFDIAFSVAGNTSYEQAEYPSLGRS
ncbi:unnamed protein product [Sphacelaria rigidula]